MILPQFGVDDMKGLLAPREPLFDERAKHSVLLVEAIEESANVRPVADHAISYVDGTFMDLHDGPPPKRIAAAHRPHISMNIDPTWLRSESPVKVSCGARHGTPVSAIDRS